MKLEFTRTNILRLTATSQELSALIAAARMSLDMMAADPQAPREAVALLQRVLRDYDAQLSRRNATSGPAPARPQDVVED